MVGVVRASVGRVPLVGGVSLARSDTGDLRGLTATTCQRPLTSAVLIGGSTTLGSSTRLVLSNPGETVATVSVTGWGATGQLPEIAPVVVPAGEVRAILLETVSLEPRLALRLDVAGGRVVPSLQDSSLNGLVPAGTETIGPAADPTTTLVIGGVELPEGDGAQAALRLLNPNDQPATVAVEMLGPDGPQVLEGAEDSVIEPGTVVDISLAGLPAGTYGIRVTADLPVSGAVRLARTGTPGEDDPDVAPVDVAWLPASAPVARGVLPVPMQLVGAVQASVTNPGEDSSTVTVGYYDARGMSVGEQSLTMAAGSTSVLGVPESTVLIAFDGEGIVAAEIVSVDIDNGTLISAFTVVADPYSEQTVAVRVTN